MTSQSSDRSRRELKKQVIIRLMNLLTDDERLDVFLEYCEGCGSKDKGCKCWLDE